MTRFSRFDQQTQRVVRMPRWAAFLILAASAVVGVLFLILAAGVALVALPVVVVAGVVMAWFGRRGRGPLGRVYRQAGTASAQHRAAQHGSGQHGSGQHGPGQSRGEDGGKVVDADYVIIDRRRPDGDQGR